MKETSLLGFPSVTPSDSREQGVQVRHSSKQASSSQWTASFLLASELIVNRVNWDGVEAPYDPPESHDLLNYVRLAHHLLASHAAGNATGAGGEKRLSLVPGVIHHRAVGFSAG